MSEYVPPASPCMWAIADRFLDSSGFAMFAITVGPCKTAFDAWKLSRLPGDFGSYQYESLTETNE